MEQITNHADHQAKSSVYVFTFLNNHFYPEKNRAQRVNSPGLLKLSFN